MSVKKSLSFSFTILVFVLLQTIISFAQYPGMAQVRINMNNQFMAQQMSMNMRMMGNFSSAEHSANSSRIQGALNEYTYLVKLKDGNTKTIKSYIYVDTSLRKSYLLFVDKSVPRADTAHRKQKIYSDKTISINRILDVSDPDSAGNVTQDLFIGMATDTCWEFKALSGKINLYSIFSEKGNSRLFDPSTIVAVQYNNGPLVNLNIDVLKNFIASDEKAMKYFNKKDYYSAIEKFDKDALKN